MKKNNIKFLKRPKLKNPIVIAAWPGMGDVAFTAAKFLKEKLKATEFAFFDPADYFRPTGIIVKDQLVDLTEMPQGVFYYYQHASLQNDLVIFISQAQPLAEKSFEYAQEILSFLKELESKMLITCAAMPTSIGHTQSPRVWAAVTHRELVKKIEKIPIDTIPSGQVSGMNGLILGVAKKAGIAGVCLLGEIPFYTIQVENPLSSVAVLKSLGALLNIELDFRELEQQALLLNQEIDRVISFIKSPNTLEDHEKPIDLDEIERIRKILSTYTKVPESVKKSIEKLFSAAKKDIAKAQELKEELDRWSIYKEYEDRFLDLFRRQTKKEN